MVNVVNHQGFLIKKCGIQEDLLSKIKKELTVTPESNFGNLIPKSFKFYIESDDYIATPIYYSLGLELRYVVNFPEIPKEKRQNYESCNIILRDYQQECFEICMKEFDKPFGGGILNLTTAFGKTIMSLKIAATFGHKTLVIINKIELIDQWKSEIKKCIPNAKIGLIQGSTFDIEGCDIVLGMLQTVSINKNFKACDFKWVDLLILDEIHNAGSDVYSRISFKIRPRYIFGLTATLERKDKMEKIVKWYVGDVIYSNISSSKKQSTEIHFYNYKGESSVNKLLRDGTAAVSTMLSNIAFDKIRTNLLLEIINGLALESEERNILVLSDRNDQLKVLHTNLGDTLSGLFIGSLKQNARDLSKTKRILLANYKMAAEGFNLPKLNCLVFATPRSSINQAIGRIFRQNHTITPVIIDIIDAIPIFKGQYFKRRKTYKELIEDPLFLNKEL
jgi:superfamily II DNA or RNA helicase